MWKNAKRIASKLLGVAPEKIENWGHLMFKPPLRGTVTPWHQDEAYWDPNLSYHAVGAWMPLDEADVDNGCLWFLPGSHRGDIGPHRHGNDDPAVHVLELIDEPDTNPAVAVPLKAGGMSFHHPRTMHYAGPNTTARSRRAWANEYQTAPVRRDVPANRPWVQAGRDALKSRAAAAKR
jgi:ectoine hydroxylase-related dioxygenase (phytanoyl-CoA dioxygenase family)